jgi:anti-anti-sigma factor
MHTDLELPLNPYGPIKGLIAGLGISHRRVGDIAVVDLACRLTRELAPRSFVHRVRELLDEGTRKFAINLERVRDFDSSGLGGLAAAYNWVKQADGEIKLFAARARVRRALNRVRLDTVFQILEDEEAALRAFDPPCAEKT